MRGIKITTSLHQWVPSHPSCTDSIFSQELSPNQSPHRRSHVLKSLPFLNHSMLCFHGVFPKLQAWQAHRRDLASRHSSCLSRNLGRKYREAKFQCPPHPIQPVTSAGAVCPILPCLPEDRIGCNMEVGVSACWVQLYSGTIAFLWDQPDSKSSGPYCGTVQLSELL